jgi:hypothetical protein
VSALKVEDGIFGEDESAPETGEEAVVGVESPDEDESEEDGFREDENASEAGDD